MAICCRIFTPAVPVYRPSTAMPAGSLSRPTQEEPGRHWLGGRAVHGTTVATNMILESKAAPTALLTNAGFKYVLEIGRQDIPRRSSLFAWVKPKRPVPPQAIFEIGGRIGADGSEIEPLDETAVADAARAIAAANIRTAGLDIRVAVGHPALDHNGTTNRVNHARELGREAVARVLCRWDADAVKRGQGLGQHSGHHVANDLLYLRFCRTVFDFDKPHPRPLEGDTLDTITPLCGAADIMPCPLVFENRNWVSVQIGNEEVASFAVNRPVCPLGLPVQSQGRIRSDDLPKAHLRKHVKWIGAGRTWLLRDIQGGAEHFKLPSPHNPACREFDGFPHHVV
ncbi:MAG: hypothetical protein JO227_21735 [Acetobacteraceae bacterium]|nr:hypothetical protein [Acetobacteraceae bacterium]